MFQSRNFSKVPIAAQKDHPRRPTVPDQTQKPLPGAGEIRPFLIGMFLGQDLYAGTDQVYACLAVAQFEMCMTV